DRAAELVGRLAAREHPADIGQGPVDDEPGLLGPFGDRLERAVAAGLDVARLHRPADAEHTEAVGVAEIVLDLAQLRRGGQRDRSAAAVDDDLERLAGADADDALHVGEAVDRLAVDRGDEVARLEAGGLRGTVGLHRVDAGAGRLAAGGGEDDGEDGDGEDEVGDRAGGDDGGARADRLEHEGDLLLLLGHQRGGVPIRDTGRILVAEEFHKAAEGNGGEFPAGAVAVVEADDLRAEADGEGLHLHAAPAGNEEVPELVEEDDDGQDEQEGHDVPRRASTPGPQARHDPATHYDLVP